MKILPHGIGVTFVLGIVGGLVTMIGAIITYRKEGTAKVVLVLGAICTFIVTALSGINTYRLSEENNRWAEQILRQTSKNQDLRPPAPRPTPSPVRLPPKVPLKIIDMAAKGQIQVGQPLSLLLATQNLTDGTLSVISAGLTGFKWLPADPSKLAEVEDSFWAGLITERSWDRVRMLRMGIVVSSSTC